MIFLARLPIVFLTLGLAITGFHFAREMWGKLSALFAFSFLLLEPNILAHGRYSTTDAGGTAFLLLAAFLLWRMWRHGGWSWIRIIAAGIGIGLALGSKLSTSIFLPIFAILAILPLYGRLWQLKDSVYRVMQLLLASLIGAFVLWLIYGLEWGSAQFTSDWTGFLEGVSLPMPTYWAGLDQILSISAGGRPSFLLGEFSTTGWWYYFPVALAVKTPLLLMILFVLSALLLLWDSKSRSNAVFLLMPAVVYFLISMQSALNIGYRHLLPILPFLLVLISGLATVKLAKPSFVARSPAFGPAVLVMALISLVVIDLLIHPSYLSYFNVIAGGPDNGHNILVDSNLDWGQDLKRLRLWMDENGEDRIKLSWFGTAEPEFYDIAYDPLPGLPYHFDLWWNSPFNPLDPEPGLYAISASNLWEVPLEEKTVFAWFRDREPDDKIGYSIHIYRVGDDA